MEEVTTVTMNDIMNDRDMKKSEGLDGQVSLNCIHEFNQIFIYIDLKVYGIFFHFNKIWRSTYENTAGFFTKATRPETITSLYEKCDSIPNVRLMQVNFKVSV